jgi:cytochrome c peroxidase
VAQPLLLEILDCKALSASASAHHNGSLTNPQLQSASLYAGIAAMAFKAVGVLIIALLTAWVSASIAVDARPVGELRHAYRRPPQIPAPQDNLHSAAKAELGRALFFDPILSGARTRSCATCHNPGLSWGDGLPRAIGEGQATMALRSPTLIAIAWVDQLGWDGKFRDLESVAFVPITGRANMNLLESVLIERLKSIPGYVRLFADAFTDRAITRRNIELALAAFQRTIVPGETAFSRWVEGDEAAMDQASRRGFALYGKGRCAECHKGYALTDGSFHDIGSAKDADVGRGRLFPKSTKLQYAFKTPTLWDVARRGPYMHDGSVPTLEAVIDLYDRGGIERPSRSQFIGRLSLSSRDKSDLIAFMHALTSKPVSFQHPVLPR